MPGYHLQKAIGNAATTRLFSGFIQAKLTVSHQGDASEREADRVADEVMRMPDPQVGLAVQGSPLKIQRVCLENEDELQRQPRQANLNQQEHKVVQPKHESDPGVRLSRAFMGGSRISPQCETTLHRQMGEEETNIESEGEETVSRAKTRRPVSDAPLHIQRFDGQSNGQLDAVTASVDQALASPDRPLEPALRQDMEQRFGHDFSHVRVHSGIAAEQSARDVNADAFTVGHNIVFGAGALTPGTHEGRRLIAHELTHVVQQSGSDGYGVAQSNENRGLSHLQHDERKRTDKMLLTQAGTHEGLVLQRQKVPAPAKRPPSPKSGFGKNPSSKSLRVKIVGHASPRWKGAKTEDEADRRNKDLARRRSEAVKEAVKNLLYTRLGHDLPIDFDVSRPDDEHPGRVDVGTSDRGSQETLEQAGGDRTRDDVYYRRVDIDIDLLTTKYHQSGQSLRPKEHSARTQFWYVTIKRLLVSGIVIPGPAWGWCEILLKNSITGRSMLYRTTLWGGGDPIPQDTADRDVGRKEFPIITDNAMGFDDFDGEFLRIERLDAALLVGASMYYLSLPNLGTDAWNHAGTEWGLGFPGGYIVSGTLKKVGESPSDWYDSDEPNTETWVTEVKSARSEGLTLTFPSMSNELSITELQRLDSFLTTNARRFGVVITEP